jgi:gluconokinase
VNSGNKTLPKTKLTIMECIISIELGTNAVRVYAFDLKGNVIGSSKGSYPTFHIDPDFSEQDPEQIFITMLYVLKNFLSEKIHPKKHSVQSVCFSAAMHSVLPIDKHGVPLGNAITWADNRGKEEARTLRESSVAAKIYEATGTPIHPMSPLIKITWLKNKDKQRFARTYKFLSIKSYIIQQLTGVYAIDYSLASATGLMDIRKKKWDDAALDYAGISRERLPELVPVSYSPGKLLPQYQVSLGLAANTKIIFGSSDGCLATLGAGVWGDGKATVTIEDSAAVRVVRKEPIKDKDGRLFNYILDDTYYISGGPSNNGGKAFEWYARQFGDFKNAYDIESCMQDLVTVASSVEAGSEGLIFLPYLLGERAPIWNANARGVYFGININHESKHFARATIEGILYEMYSIGRLLEEHDEIKQLSVNGSFATIPFWTQAIADIFNKPVSISPNVNSVSLGAYLLSATDLGIFASLDEAARSIELQDAFKPNKHHHKIHSGYYEIFETLSRKLSGEFEKLNQLQSMR